MANGERTGIGPQFAILNLPFAIHYGSPSPILMSENASDMLRRTVCFSGMVQGVNFRYTTRTVASRFSVTGYVRNLPDGRVELVAEGARDELDRFQRAVADAMHGYIKHTTIADTTATDEFISFTIAM